VNFFKYKNNILEADDVRIDKIANNIGTPFYLYSYKTLKRHFHAIQEPLEKISHLVCYSIKACSNISILKLLYDWGSGFDIVSGGELYRALKIGTSPQKIVFSGVGKTEDELAYAISSDILMINVESESELLKINEIGARLNKIPNIALRINPNINPKTHPFISTGLKINKFGLEKNEVIRLAKLSKKLPNVKLIGIDSHIGSQLTSLQPFVKSLEIIKNLILYLKNENIIIKYLDIGGGLGITYNEESPPHPKNYAKEIIKRIKDLDVTLILEPGRVIIGNAGILVTRVIYKKIIGNKNFVICDAGMNDFIRPSFYNAYQKIIPIKKERKIKIMADIVGPVCESSDYFGLEREIPNVKEGDLLCIMTAGAYGYTMSSNYNSRRKIPEVLAKDKKFYIITERETYEDLIRKEHLIKIDN
jgi:diaminopimelate decarboxylase